MANVALEENDKSERLVSVCMITYNHENYIAQAIDSALQQQTAFPFEIVIGEDCSTDRTREICLEYQKRHPEVIRLLLPKQNIGAMPNFKQTLNSCRGRYLALLEGDDFWTDPLKLQKQVDFLAKNSRYVGTAHRVRKIGLSDDFLGSSHDQSHEFADFLGHRLFHTASLMIDREATGPYDLPTNITSGDRALFLYCANRGPIYYSADCMAVYRKHAAGLSMSVKYADMTKDLAMAKWAADRFDGFPRHHYLSFIYRTVFFYSHNLTMAQKAKTLARYALHKTVALLSPSKGTGVTSKSTSPNSRPSDAPKMKMDRLSRRERSKP